jgi:TonB family protein
LKHRGAALIVGLTAIALPLVAIAMVGGERSNPVSTRAEPAYAAPAAPLTDSMALMAATLQGSVARASTETSKDSVSADRSANTKSNGGGSRSTAADETAPNTSETVASWIPTLPRPTVSRLDSVVGALAPLRTTAEAFSIPVSNSATAVARSIPSESDSVTAPQRARLIGSLPTPRYPARMLLAKVGGEVVVRFQIDTSGRPVMNTFSVLSTPDAGLTAAVRRVIPSLRFEPARSAGPEFKAITDVTELSFRFAPDTRE